MVDLCENNNCMVDEKCMNGECVKIDPCTLKTCSLNEKCVNG